MAMIVCTECGKRFSDKAICCPECGCPIEAIMGTSLSEHVEKDSARARKAMLAEVNKAKLEADKANKLFDRCNDAIQAETSSDINLFSENAASRAISIVAKAKRACDSLYSSLQTLVVEVDSVCRPYLTDKPGAEAIKAVADLIESLNDDSEIENSGTMTFNGLYIGDASATTYMPSVQARMIQKFWASQYSSTPEGAAEEAQRRKAAEEIRRRRETDQKKREERKAAAKRKMDRVLAECKDKISAYGKALDAEIECRLEQVASELALHCKETALEKARLEREVSGLGLFSIREKQKKNKAIRELDVRLAKLSDKGLLDVERARLKQRADAAVAEYGKTVEQYLDERFLNRHPPKRPRYSWQTAPDTTVEDTARASDPYPEPLDPSEALG